MTSSLERIGFRRVLEKVASHAASESGRNSVMSLQPAWEPAAAEELRRQTETAARLLQRKVRLDTEGLNDMESVISRLKDGVLVLDPVQIRTSGLVLEGFNSFLGALRFPEEDGPDTSSLSSLTSKIPDLMNLSRKFMNITTEEGELSRNASREYGRLLKRVDRLKRNLSKRISKLSSSLSRRGVLRDSPPTVREGRYVLPVISSRKKDVNGIVHDRSESGETFFIEPSELVGEGNELREALLDLDYEKRCILRNATSEIRERMDEIDEGIRAAASLDAVFARASYHLAESTVFPSAGDMKLRNLGHPLIPADELVSNTLELPGDWKVLIVSGPNAGGKSVLLKAAGLAAACSQSGIGVFADADSSMPFFSRIFVSIGDQQSIEDHRSTYSARLMEQLEMMSGAQSHALALIDEPAAGTDPTTGTALAASVLETLAGRGCRVIVTTHHGQLKSLAQDREGFYSGSMNFHIETLEPDYVYTPGIPGSSYTLEIAKRMDFPEQVLKRARELSGDSFKLDRMLEEITENRKLTEERLKELEESRKELSNTMQRKTTQLEKAREDLRSRLKQVEREHEEKMLRINSEADSLLARLARSGGGDERREIREKIRETAQVESGGETPPVDSGDASPDIKAGDWVTVKGWSGAGRVEMTGDGYAMVVMGNMKLRKSLEDLQKTASPEEGKASAGWSVPVEARTEIDLRGMSTEEALAEVDLAIEDALVAGISRIRIIHGKGKGVLMRAVVDKAKRDGRIMTFRQGKPSEGGTGVTVIGLGNTGKS